MPMTSLVMVEVKVIGNGDIVDLCIADLIQSGSVELA